MDSNAQAEQFLSGGGEMGALIRSMDWSDTPLGPTNSWPQSLRTSVSLCLSSTFPILIAWGPETIQIYNDSYRPICGAKHPEAMGQNFRVCWATALPVVGDAFTRGEHGEGTYIRDQRMFLDRYGYLEESFMTFSFAPIRDETGEVGGIFHPITETTEKMLSARRTKVLRDISAATASARDLSDLITALDKQYADYQFDLPFLQIYICEPDRKGLSLALVTGLSANSDAAISFVENCNLETTGWAVPAEHPGRFVATGIADRFSDITCGPYPETPNTACIYPVRIPGQADAYGYIIAGVSARRALDDDYLSFYDQLSAIINTSCSSIDAYFQEARKIAAMAAIDQAKTAFFNNVSHEFRTPLTLMMGPLEEMLSTGQIRDPLLLEPLQTVQRNAFRLLKLVNNLLDFSRQEAGRVSVRFQPVDLAAMTRDVVSSFRSVMEKAGLVLNVHCEYSMPMVYVDPVMWEKILLNLLSNAFKFTMEGSVTVTLATKDETMQLTIADTGAGIPEDDIPRMFQRFHRVQGTTGRSFEGSGIGLSLVKELVDLHHGKIKLSSQLGKGSEFIISVPLGSAHLPPDHVDHSALVLSHSTQTAAFLQEAEGLVGNVGSDISSPNDNSALSRILIVDDNADMRAYLSRLLSPWYVLHTASQGLEALEVMDGFAPDVIISDIMMPVMDGKQLLERIRANAAWSGTPVIFLSARAGDEAKVEGLEAGAEDYLVKPFSASELLSRVRIQVNQSRRRDVQEMIITERTLALSEANEHLRRQNEELRQFAFVSSHDLQEPLRKMHYFADRAVGIINEGSSSQEVVYPLQKIRQSAKRLSALVTDLLSFARVDTEQVIKQPTDLNIVWEQVKEDFDEHITKTGAQIVSNTLPVVNAYPLQMHRLLSNLLSNALKFHNGRPTISLHGSQSGQSIVLRFADDGIGFAAEHSERIFQVFQRLHGSQDFDGTGIGLAIVKKIIDRHAGHVEVQSNPDHGTVFTIVLPQ